MKRLARWWRAMFDAPIFTITTAEGRRHVPVGNYRPRRDITLGASEGVTHPRSRFGRTSLETACEVTVGMIEAAHDGS